MPGRRLLRDSHLDLEIETLKENSHLILNLDSQFFCENSHSHSQLSFSNSQKSETSRLNLVDCSGNFSNISLQFWMKILIWRVIKDALLVSIRPSFLRIRRLILSFDLIFSFQNSHSHSTLNFSLWTLILILDSQIFPWEVSFSISTLSKLTLAEVCQPGRSKDGGETIDT